MNNRKALLQQRARLEARFLNAQRQSHQHARHLQIWYHTHQLMLTIAAMGIGIGLAYWLEKPKTQQPHPRKTHLQKVLKRLLWLQLGRAPTKMLFGK